MTELFAVTLIIVLAAISPGPDFAMVVKNSLMHDRKAGIYTALGVSSSLIIHVSYCMLGLALVISKSLLLFNLIKYVGAAYLIYIGIKSVMTDYHGVAMRESHKHKPISNFQAFSQGLLCNLLNPKAIMFILAFFTLIINPTTSWSMQIVYGIEIGLIHFIWFSMLSLMITHHRVKSNLNKIQHYIVKVMGVVLIAFGARIALLEQH